MSLPGGSCAPNSGEGPSLLPAQLCLALSLSTHCAHPRVLGIEVMAISLLLELSGPLLGALGVAPGTRLHAVESCCGACAGLGVHCAGARTGSAPRPAAQDACDGEASTSFGAELRR